MSRTTEFEPNVALEQAVDVFWDKGYFDTSMDDLIKSMGVARYGVYNTWGNKHELFLADDSCVPEDPVPESLFRYWISGSTYQLLLRPEFTPTRVTIK